MIPVAIAAFFGFACAGPLGLVAAIVAVIALDMFRHWSEGTMP